MVRPFCGRARPATSRPRRRQQYRSRLEAAGLAPASINLRLSAVRKLVSEAAENGFPDRNVAQAITSIGGARQSGGGELVDQGSGSGFTSLSRSLNTGGKRDRAILAVLIGCALRRSEFAVLTVENLVQRDGRWVFADLLGKGKRVRTVPVRAWVKVALDAWTSAAAIQTGAFFRRVRLRQYKTGTPEILSERMIWHVVTLYARRIGLRDLAPGRAGLLEANDLVEYRPPIWRPSLTTAPRHVNGGFYVHPSPPA